MGIRGWSCAPNEAATSTQTIAVGSLSQGHAVLELARPGVFVAPLYLSSDSGDSRVLMASGAGWASRLRATGQMHQTANEKRTDLAYIKALANTDPQTS